MYWCKFWVALQKLLCVYRANNYLSLFCSCCLLMIAYFNRYRKYHLNEVTIILLLLSQTLNLLLFVPTDIRPISTAKLIGKLKKCYLMECSRCRCICGMHVPGVYGCADLWQSEDCSSGRCWHWAELHGRQTLVHFQLFRALRINRHSLLLLFGFNPSG